MDNSPKTVLTDISFRIRKGHLKVQDSLPAIREQEAVDISEGL